MNIVFELVFVTAALAAGWLKLNTVNRHMSPSGVGRLRRDMNTSGWALTHEPIAFAPSGWLVDGQHRLAAIVEAADGDPTFGVWLYVARYTDETAARAAQLVINQGRKRTIGEQSEIVGLWPKGKGSTYAAVSACMLMLEADKDVGVGEDIRTPTQGETRGVYLKHKDSIDWAVATLKGRQEGFSAPVLCAMAYAWEVYPDKIEDLATAILTKVAEAGSAAQYWLRYPVKFTTGGTGGGRGARLALMHNVLRLAQAHVQGVGILKLQASDAGVVFFAAAHRRQSKPNRRAA